RRSRPQRAAVRPGSPASTRLWRYPADSLRETLFAALRTVRPDIGMTQEEPLKHRRVWALGLGLGALAQVAVGVSPLAAAAAPETKSTLEISVPNYVVAPGTTGRDDSYYLRSSVKEIELQDATMTVDSSGLVGFAIATHRDTSLAECTTEGATQRCSLRLLTAQSECQGYDGIVVKPLPGAKVGQKGTFSVTLAAANAQPVTVDPLGDRRRGSRSAGHRQGADGDAEDRRGPPDPAHAPQRR
ncbi:MAG: hypothetical protein QOJ50_2013, partial [Cryptosporangiaceae bacterium]|nr:hypothetical protein [Cryptosporangiaceae bacterium]